MERRPRGWMRGAVVGLALLAAGGGAMIGGEARGQVGSGGGGEPLVAGPRGHQDLEAPGDATPPAVPGNVSWVRVEALGIMWTFIAAILLGPVALYFWKEPGETK